jgi:hypothetical protein
VHPAVWQALVVLLLLERAWPQALVQPLALLLAAPLLLLQLRWVALHCLGCCPA